MTIPDHTKGPLARLHHHCAKGTPIVEKPVIRLFSDRVLETAQRMNWNRGAGTINQCRVFADGRVECVVTRYGCKQETRRGHVKGNRLFFLRSSAKIAE
jgi:hypothetical protein